MKQTDGVQPLPADALADVLVHLGELGLQVLQQPVQQLWNTPLLLSQASLQHVQTAGGERERETGRRSSTPVQTHLIPDWCGGGGGGSDDDGCRGARLLTRRPQTIPPLHSRGTP